MSNSTQTTPALAGDFAEVVIYAKSPEEKAAARRIANAIAETPDGKGVSISIRNGSAPPAPGTYSK
jgi:hypothetical protein